MVCTRGLMRLEVLFVLTGAAVAPTPASYKPLAVRQASSFRTRASSRDGERQGRSEDSADEGSGRGIHGV